MNRFILNTFIIAIIFKTLIPKIKYRKIQIPNIHIIGQNISVIYVFRSH